MNPTLKAEAMNLAHSYVWEATGSIPTANALAPRIAHGWCLLAEAITQSHHINENFKHLAEVASPSANGPGDGQKP